MFDASLTTARPTRRAAMLAWSLALAICACLLLPVLYAALEDLRLAGEVEDAGGTLARARAREEDPQPWSERLAALKAFSLPTVGFIDAPDESSAAELIEQRVTTQIVGTQGQLTALSRQQSPGVGRIGVVFEASVPSGAVAGLLSGLEATKPDLHLEAIVVDAAQPPTVSVHGRLVGFWARTQ